MQRVENLSKFQIFMNTVLKEKEYLILNVLRELNLSNQWYETGILSLYYAYQVFEHVDVHDKDFDPLATRLIKEMCKH
jgi:hypothetical protein